MMAENQAINYYLPTARPQAQRNVTLPVGPNWLQDWLQGHTPDQAVLEQYGFQTQHFYAVVIYRAAGSSVNGEQFAGLLQAEANRRGIKGPVMPYESSAVLFHPVEEPRQTMRLKHKTEEIRQQLSARLNGEDVCCGVGRPAQGSDNLRQSFCEAESAVGLCDELRTQSRATFFGNSSLYGLLLSLNNPSELQRFCTTWLADLMAYDNDQHSELIETLGAYFGNNGNTALTAKELNIHRNTLAYRLNRIAEITCLDLDDADVRLNLHLALKAREVLKATPIQ
ncbi:MAG TPA: helix-turn-helix domain-containing protein [Aggregatilineales bacterium]|nr:helix-turn-helix domain-containing protein [Aggregatilineales bacterium]